MKCHRLPTARVLLLAAVLAGCGGTDTAIFATGTDIGIHADAKLQTATIGFDRIELFAGPAFVDIGAAPPAVGFLASNLELFTPKVRQLYATGTAAELVTQVEKPNTDSEQQTLTGARMPMVFGTATHIGLNIGFTAGQPDRIGFGFKRREASVIPIRASATPDTARGPGDPQRPGQPAEPNQHNQYASTLASIDMGVDVQRLSRTSLKVAQFVATGTAARNLAKRDDIRNLFLKEATLALSAGAIDAATQQDLRMGIARCISSDAGTLGAPEQERLDKMLQAAVTANAITEAQKTALLTPRPTNTAALLDSLKKVLSGQADKLDKVVQGNKTLCAP